MNFPIFLITFCVIHNIDSSIQASTNILYIYLLTHFIKARVKSNCALSLLNKQLKGNRNFLIK